VVTSTVAAFDVDGTLLDGESLFRFLGTLLGPPGLAAVCVRTAVRAAARLPRLDRDTGKAALLRTALCGRGVAQTESVGQYFAERLLATRVRPDALQALRAHQAAGHQVVLISASPGMYIRPLGSLLGVDGALCTELEVGADGTYTGALSGSNARGIEKLHLLDRWLAQQGLQRDQVLIHAYGDSSGDDELLAAAGSRAQDRRRQRVLAFDVPPPDLRS